MWTLARQLNFSCFLIRKSTDNLVSLHNGHSVRQKFPKRALSKTPFYPCTFLSNFDQRCLIEHEWVVSCLGWRLYRILIPNELTHSIRKNDITSMSRDNEIGGGKINGTWQLSERVSRSLRNKIIDTGTRGPESLSMHQQRTDMESCSRKAAC